jgi:hypothetical protein
MTYVVDLSVLLLVGPLSQNQKEFALEALSWKNLTDYLTRQTESHNRTAKDK